MPVHRRFRTYDEAFAWLASKTNYETMATQRYDERTYGLARVVRLLDAAGRPDRAFDVAQVVGSKGKGSTSAALASILRAAGRRTGLFTSPHLIHPRERIAVDGAPIDDRHVMDALDTLHAHVEGAAARGEPATFFEIQTVAALLAFRAAGCDAVVLEAGMGGRLDATSAADACVKVLSSVSLDHVEHLGRTRAAIAREKCAVARPGVPFVCGEPMTNEAGQIAASACHEVQAPLHAVGRDFRVIGAATEFDARTGASRTAFRLRHDGRTVAFEVPLLGVHQARNASLAAVAARVGAWRTGAIPDDVVRAGLAATAIRARLEAVSVDPLVLVDGAHTPASFAVLAKTLRDVLRAAPADARPGVHAERRIVFVVGMAADKDIAGSLRKLRGTASHVVATSSGQPRAATPETIAEVARRVGLDASSAPSIGPALAAALRRAGDDGVVVVTGSLYLCGAALEEYAGGGGAA